RPGLRSSVKKSAFAYVWQAYYAKLHFSSTFFLRIRCLVQHPGRIPYRASRPVTYFSTAIFLDSRPSSHCASGDRPSGTQAPDILFLSRNADRLSASMPDKDPRSSNILLNPWYSTFTWSPRSPIMGNTRPHISGCLVFRALRTLMLSPLMGITR